MKLVIGGVEYELQAAMEKASLNDLFAMTLETGVGMATLGANLEKVNTADPFAMDDPKVLNALRCLIYLAKRYAGVTCTVASANVFPFSELDFVAEDSDSSEDDADPTPRPE